MPSLEKRTEPVHDTIMTEQSPSSLDTALDAKNIQNICNTNQVSLDKGKMLAQ